MALVEWTSLGEEALRGRQYFSFSPTFLCDSLTGKVNGLVSNHAAGALTNSPAFQNAMPALVAASLWEPGGIDRALAEISIQIQTIKRKMTS
jgi:phage I-like protein